MADKHFIEWDDYDDDMQFSTGKFHDCQIIKDLSITQWLFDTIIGNDGFIGGSYALWVCSDKWDWVPNDIDVYPKSEDAFNLIFNNLIGSNHQITTNTDRGVFFKSPGKSNPAKHVHLIKCYEEDMKALLQTFDFINLMYGVYANHDGSLSAVKPGNLVLIDTMFPSDNINNPIESIHRLLKYQRRGFEIEEAYHDLIVDMSRSSPSKITSSFYEWFKFHGESTS